METIYFQFCRKCLKVKTSHKEIFEEYITLYYQVKFLPLRGYVVKAKA